MNGHTRALTFALSMTLLACAGSAEDTPREHFDEAVLPILEAGCAQSTCHGVTEADGHEDLFGGRFLGLPVDDEGRIAGAERGDGAYASALQFIDTEAADPRDSSLIRKVLSAALGGEVHDGGVSIESLEAPAYLAIARWIELEEGGGEGVPEEELSDLERLFRQTVAPVLSEKRCMTGNCHGPKALLSTLRQAAPFDGTLSPVRARKNRGNARRHISLDGPATVSRLVLKAVPVAAGGLLHKGGNDNFFTGLEDPALAPVLEWIEAEQREEMGEAPSLAGLVFVRGPIEARAPLDLGQPHFGSDLWWLDPFDSASAPRNLTAAHHQGAADVRDPAVNHEADRIAFAMRRSPDEAMNLYEMDLDGGGLRQLTNDTARAGFVPINAQPTYGPDGHLYFSSTRSGELGDRGLRPNADLWALDLESGEMLRRTYGPNQELYPAFLRYGGVAGELAFTSTRRFGEVFNAPVFRFPPGLSSEYHVHFGTQRAGEMLLGIQDTAFGLHVLTAVDEDAVWSAGRLAVIDRNFGPDIPDEARVDEATLPRFAHTLGYLTEVGALYRDPFPLPDGRLLAARGGTVDPTDPAALVDYAVVALELGRTADGHLQVANETVLVDAGGLADLQPVPVIRRALEPAKGHHTDFESPTGLVNMFNLPLLQALVETLEPRAKVLREDLRYVRVVAAQPLDAEAMRPLDPSEVRNGNPASNRVTNGVHDPVAVLGTVPLGRDGSFYIEVPANLAIRFQALNENKMAVGAQHDRWIFANPGEELFHSTHIDVYAARCAGCHGALEASPERALVPQPDAITGASISESTHEGANALRPREPIAVGLDGQRRVIDFARDLQPILDRSCAVGGCHAGPSPVADLSLGGEPTTHYSDAYESLLARDEEGAQRYVDEPRARAVSSPLIARLYGQPLETGRDPEGQCPPADAPVPPLSAAEREAFVEWVDLGATFAAP